MQRAGKFEASKFQRAMMEFRNGNLNRADELLNLGASPTAVAGVVKTSAAYHAKNKQPSPEDAGYGAPGSGVRFTGD